MTLTIGDSFELNINNKNIMRFFTKSVNVAILAKVKDKKLYVARCFGNTNLVHTFGVPNRNLELEWGDFSGRSLEFIISEKAITELGHDFTWR